jgi:hypothetical protein
VTQVKEPSLLRFWVKYGIVYLSFSELSQREVIAVASTGNTTIGTPAISEYRAGICLPTEQISNAIYTLTALYGEQDYDGVDKIVEQAMSTIEKGSNEMPALASALISKSLTGSYVARRDMLDAAYAASGNRTYVFEHNSGAGRMNPTLYSACIRIEPVLADHSLCIMDVSIRNSKITAGLKGTVEQVLAESLGATWALQSLDIHVPIQIERGTHYRFDLEPFVDALRLSKATPGEHMPFTEVNGRSVSDFVEKRYLNQCDRLAGDLYSPQIHTVLPDGVTSTLGFDGCMFSGWDVYEQTRTVHSTRTGTVFSGPIRTKFQSDELETPSIWLGLKVEASSYLPDREQLALDLAAKLAHDITDLHNH